LEYGDVGDGAIVAFKLEEKNGKLTTPAWMSQNMNRAEPPVIANGVVFAYGNGEDTTQSYPDAGLADTPNGAFPDRLVRSSSSMPWRHRPEKRCGPARIRSHRGTIGAGFPSPTAGFISVLTIATCIATA
jgi:hypothetical protein